jgi:hypothetical protein
VIAGGLGSGFAIYAFCLYVLSLVACCVCPCLGAAGATGTSAIWALLWALEILVLATTSYVGAILSLVALVRLFSDRTTRPVLVVANFVVQALVAAAFAATVGIDWIIAPFR